MTVPQRGAEAYAEQQQQQLNFDIDGGFPDIAQHDRLMIGRNSFLEDHLFLFVSGLVVEIIEGNKKAQSKHFVGCAL